MTNRPTDEEAVFHIARKLDDPSDCAKYLDQICAGDLALRNRVEELLRVHEQEENFLKSSPTFDPGPTVDHTPLTERPGTTIGRYRLMEQIGEGGMGVVFVAEQERPIRRKVALKVVKPGMDTREVVARFEAERQALALMDHPNIAKVLDAGSTESGRAYFVMELVRGMPITEYCDQNNLPIRERLDLFIEVCRAVQHAHQKGIIHRDLKPTNVLVTLHDGVPVVKVIDFGVAKATNQRLTERTVYTRFAQIIGTPIYMSPEQAELSGLDIDTRSDIYSLGVLLYELLTGTTPFDKERFEKAAYDEIRRIVREEEPLKPSTKISTLGEMATAVSAHRATDPRSLSRSITGDLDVIVMKAIEKDRTRRYDTASGLADDVQRFLKDEAIIARPPSLAYRFGKFARRNRAAVATSALVLASLVLGVIACGWMATVAQREAERARERLRMFATASYEKAITDVLINDQDAAQEALRIAENAGASRSQILILKGLMALNRGENDEAIRLAKEALADSPNNIGARALLTVACIWAGYDDLGELELYRLRQENPQSDADRLLMAYALLSSDPQEGKRLLEDRPRIQRSPIGLLIRGFENLVTESHSKNAKLADRAVRDFEYVQFLFHDSQASLAFRLLALASSIRLAESEGRHADADRFVEEGRPLAKQLATVAGYPAGDWSRQQFHLAVGDDEEARQAIRNVGRHPGTYSWFLGADCLGRYGAAAMQEFDKAIAAEHKGSRYVRLAKAYLLGDSHERTQEVHALVGDMLVDPSPLIRRHALLALCLASEPEEVRALAAPTTISGLWNDVACLDYLAGRLTERQLLDEASHHSFSVANAHFTIGMMRLAARDRNGAYEHFKMCVAADAVASFDGEWARAFLARMDADPAWPSWMRDNEVAK